jgi:hypothetical protein
LNNPGLNFQDPGRHKKVLKPLLNRQVISNTPEASPQSSVKTFSHSKPAPDESIPLCAKAIASHFNQHQSSTTLKDCIAQQAMPLQQADSGGIRAMFSRFGSLKALPQLLTAIACPARVKRHNTSAWITGRISNLDYNLLNVPIDAIRSQHSIDGEAIEKTAQRASRILAWLKANPSEKTIDMDAMDELAGSSGALKIGCAKQNQLITLDGVGRLEAIRQAKANYLAETGLAHPLERIECYVARLRENEYESLYKTSSYFRDEAGKQLETPEHDLMPYSGLPRLFAGQALNLARHSIESSLSSFSNDFNRQVPEHYFSEPPDQK